jgi:hypothetical protein
MIKKKYILLIISFAIILFLFWKKDGSLVKISLIEQKIEGKKDSVKTPDEATPMKKAILGTEAFVNVPSKNWEQKLKQSLIDQAGDSQLSIEIKKEKSLIWTRDENPFKVESVIVKLTNHQNVESSFRALVDPQTGKVLESWDQTIFDPANVKDNFSFKLDSRYNQ